MKSYLSLIPISARLRKKQNTMTIICIVMSVFLVTAVFSMADMAVRMEKRRLILKNGNADVFGAAGFFASSYIRGLYIAAAVLAVLILLAGVFMIAGSLSSNVAERTQFFGMLRCVGASKKQIINFVRLEALNWCKIAIPAGVISGVAISWILCGILKIVAKSEFELLPVFEISPVGIICGIIVGIFTVLIAARSPAKRAAAVSPMMAVKGNYADQSLSKNHAVKMLFSSIGTNLGIHHAASEKKKMILMTGSFALSIIMFLCFSVLVKWVYSALNMRWYAADLLFRSVDKSCTIDVSLVDEIKKCDNVTNAYGWMYKNLSASYEGKDAEIDFLSYGDYQIDMAKGDLAYGDLSKVKDGGNYVLVVFDRSNNLKPDDVIRLDPSTYLTVAGVLSESPFESDDTPTVICSEATFKRLTKEENYAEIDVKFSRQATDEDINKVRAIAGNDYKYVDRLDENRESTSVLRAFSIVVYGFLFIIAMITVLNIINSISMSVSAKYRRYGIMRAIGMETDQLTHMIMIETITYVIRGAAAGCAIGLPLHGFLYSKMITHYFGTPWRIPIMQLLIIVSLMAISSLLAVRTPAKRIKNMAITKTINEL